MSEKSVLIETSFADAIAMIAAATELPDQKRHWSTSLRQIAKALDKPLGLIPARYSAVRADLAVLHHAPAGLTAKTLQNHKSNAKSALLWLAREKDIPRHGAPLSPEWERLRVEIRDPLVRSRLSSLMRFCSTNKIGPAEVDEALLDRFMAYRSKTVRRSDDAFRRLLTRAWNSNIGNVPGWPACALLVPRVKPAVEQTWEDFPEGLRRDVNRYLQGLTQVRRSRTGQRIRPLRPSTIRTRRAELQAAARMAVRTGVPIASLDSLSALLAPDVGEKILEAYWVRNGENPKLFTIDLARRFLAIAKETKCVDDAACERLDELRRYFEDYRQGGLTEKNITLIRQVLTPIAVGIAILSVAPVRLANLAAIRLGTNLIKPDGPDSNYWLVFPDYDVKNRVKLEYPLPKYLTELIDEYVHDFRPTLMRSTNEDWLFPGQRRGAKNKICLSGQISERIYKATGVRMTVHQFRHAAGAIILMKRPGEYELVRQILGHRSVQTTIDAYVGLENIRASEIFSKMVIEHMTDGLEAAE
jgi:integrase